MDEIPLTGLMHPVTRRLMPKLLFEIGIKPAQYSGFFLGIDLYKD